MSINAKAARELTEKNLHGEVIEDYVVQIDIRIQGACGEGVSKINHPDEGLKKGGIVVTLSTGVRNAIKAHYENRGFAYEDHPNPDPGDPRSRPYSTLSW